MRTPFSIILVFIVFNCSYGSDLVSCVDPFIGTEGPGTEYGGTVPSVGSPFANIYWSPMTRLNGVSTAAYNRLDKDLLGFIGTRQPAVWMGDYGEVSLFPGIGDVKVDPLDRAQPLQRTTEKASPDRYEVTMGHTPTDSIHTELVARHTSSLFRFEFPEGTTPYVVVDASRDSGPDVTLAAKNLRLKYPWLFGAVGRSSQEVADGWVSLVPDKNQIIGWNSDRQTKHLGPYSLPNFKGWFVIQFDRPFKAFGTYTGSKIAGTLQVQANAMEARANSVGAYVTFDQTSPLVAAIGTSLISLEQAKANLLGEISKNDLESVAATTRAEWNQILSRIQVESSNQDWRKIFYTAMYRAHQFPHQTSENGSYYSAFDDAVHKGDSYNDYSLWDTYRAQYPLMILTVPDRAGPMVQALLDMYQQGGWLPLWPNPSETNIMAGSPAEIFIATAKACGVENFDNQEALAAIKHQAFTPPDHDLEYGWPDRGTHFGPPVEARGGLSYYLQNGYVPIDKTGESVSRTLDFSFADWASSQFARAVGDSTTADELLKRSSNWKNMWDPTWSLAKTQLKSTSVTGFFRPKKLDGTWADYQGNAYTESNPIEAFFAVPHDMDGLIEIAGGPAAFEKRLNDFFFIAKRHHHDNEPSHHIPYLWNYIGRPDKTQEIVRRVMMTLYKTTAAGYAGNEDCGQMSAWYVLSSLGFYPVNPVSARFDLGTPLWDRAVLTLGPPGALPKTLVIQATPSPVDHPYIESVSLNGKPLNRLYINYRELVAGGVLEFKMSSTPSLPLAKP